MTTSPTRRIDRGRSHSYLLDGEKADSVTWVISNGIAKPALIGWAANTTRDYAVDHWDELSAASPTERIKRLTGARFEELNAASGRGTDIHKLALSLAYGEEVEVPEPLEGHVDAYLRFIEEWRPEELLAETICGNRKYRYMGTFDLIAKIGGFTWLLDFKTTKSGIYPETALQLAAYAHAEFILDGDGAESAMPEIHRAGGIWLRADGYELVPVDISEATFRTFLYAQQMAYFVTGDRGLYVGEALPAPEIAA